MMVEILLIVVCVIGTIPKDLFKSLKELEIRRRIMTIQTTARRPDENYCHSDSSERRSVNAGAKNSPGV